MNKMTLKPPSQEARVPDPIDIHVGRRLRERRNLLGLSQEELGKLEGVTFQQIQKYESGANRMGASRLYRLGRHLGVQVAYFYEHLEEGEAGLVPSSASAIPQANDDLFSKRETLELVRNFYRIADVEKRKRISDLIRSMAD